jgi:hypothetical protein
MRPSFLSPDEQRRFLRSLLRDDRKELFDDDWDDKDDDDDFDEEDDFY